MRVAGLLLVLLILAGAANGRELRVYDAPVSGDDFGGDLELQYGDGEFEKWGTASGWAEEQQVGFLMPSEDPWMLVFARFWISGTQAHTVVLREAPDGITGAPGAIIDASISFVPGYPGAPTGWVDVSMASLGLFETGGRGIFVGVALTGDDCGIGLDTTQPHGASWGYRSGHWIDDSSDWGVGAGIRLVAIEPVFAQDHPSWADIKALFQ